MPTQRPFISIVIPTRDRPALVEECLKFLKSQSCHNFEVILSDNKLLHSSHEVFAKYEDDHRFHYFTPSEPLEMCEHWEFAISHAKGEYVTVISDKYFLRPDAIEILVNIVEKYPAEIISWRHETVSRLSDKKFRYVPQYKPSSTSYFSSEEELKRRFSFAQRCYSREVGVQECRGKIYSGCFHHKLIKKIKNTYGKLFPRNSPDLTSMLFGLSLAERCLDIGQPMFLSMADESCSNGYQCATSIRSIKAYMAERNQGKDYVASLPLPNFWVGIHNSIAHDYFLLKKLSKEKWLLAIDIDLANLYLRAREDLAFIEDWENEDDKLALINTWESLVDKLPRVTKNKINASKVKEFEDKPSTEEIHFAGGEDIGILKGYVSPAKRCELNWKRNSVFRIEEAYLYYKNADEAMNYFVEYYQESTQLLGFVNHQSIKGEK